MNGKDVVVNLIRMNGSHLVSRSRLQKGAYLLNRCGAKFELTFTYHHYGPYSSELTYGWEDAQAEGRIEIEEETGQHGVRYSVFRLKHSGEDPENLGDLSADTATKLVRKMGRFSDTVLELAATIVYLRENGYGERTFEELRMRKPLKAAGGRIERARDLLCDLGLKEDAMLLDSPAI